MPVLAIDFDPGTDGTGQDGNFKVLCQCQRHSMFVSSSTDAFFLDPTATHYGRTRGKQEYDEYLRGYGHPGSPGPHITTFGSRHEKMLDRARGYPEGSRV